MHKDGVNMFTHIMQMHGKAYRDVGVRKTIQVNIDGKSYFIKQHFGVGWREIAKNLLSFKVPVLGAMTEVKAIQMLDAIGIATTPLVAYGQRGRNPAHLQSFVITADLGDIISLDFFPEALIILTVLSIFCHIVVPSLIMSCLPTSALYLFPS